MNFYFGRIKKFIHALKQSVPSQEKKNMRRLNFDGLKFNSCAQ